MNKCCIHCLAHDGQHPRDDHADPCEWCAIDTEATDRLVWEVSRQLREHIDATVVTGAGGQRALFQPEADRLARIALRAVGAHLADAAAPPAEDSMATDEDLSAYAGMHEASQRIRALTEGAWDR
jgi:hypothetical protein